jgi:hypothetical protein
VLQFERNHSETSVQRWFHTNCAKKNRLPFTSDRNLLLKLVAFVLRKIVGAGDQVTRLEGVRASFLRSLFRRASIAGHVYLDVLERFLVPKLDVNNNLATRSPSPLSNVCDAVSEPDIPGEMDRLLHSVTTHIARSDTLGLIILGIRER